MPRFFITPDSIAPDGSTAVITGDDARHISRSLRMRAGEAITLCDGCGTDFSGEIAAIGAHSVTVAIHSSAPCESEPPYRAVVYQALVRGERFDTAIQKSVEFGAAAIVPVATDRATVRLAPGDADKKRARWQRIATEAAMQCGRGVIPVVGEPMDFAEAISDAPGTRLFCYEEERTLHLRDALAAAGDQYSSDRRAAFRRRKRSLQDRRERRRCRSVGAYCARRAPRRLRSRASRSRLKNEKNTRFSVCFAGDLYVALPRSRSRSRRAVRAVRVTRRTSDRRRDAVDEGTSRTVGLAGRQSSARGTAGAVGHRRAARRGGYRRLCCSRRRRISIARRRRRLFF